jgi:DNA-binding NtrC family response regulator
MSTYHIFLVDPDRSHAQRIKDQLRNYSDYIINIFTDARECKNKIKEVKPSVIFFDNEMQKDDETIKKDVEMMKELKELSPSSEIILFTGEERLHLMPGTVKDGTHEYVIKKERSKIHAENAILNAIRNYKQALSNRRGRVILTVLSVFVLMLLVFAFSNYFLGFLNIYQ